MLIGIVTPTGSQNTERPEVGMLSVVPKILLAHKLLLVVNNEKNTKPQADKQ